MTSERHKDLTSKQTNQPTNQNEQAEQSPAQEQCEVPTREDSQGRSTSTYSQGLPGERLGTHQGFPRELQYPRFKKTHLNGLDTFK